MRPNIVRKIVFVPYLTVHKNVFIDLVVVLMEKLPHLDRMPRDVKKISLAKMDHLVVVQTNGLLRKDLISRDASSVLKRYVVISTKFCRMAFNYSKSQIIQF